MRSVYETAVAEANVYVGVYDVSGFVDHPEWRELSNKQRFHALNLLEPIKESWASNTTCIGLDEYRALNSDASRDVDDKPVELALGDDGTSPAYNNRSLNNELGRTTIDEYDVDGTDIIFNSYLPSHEITDDGSGNNPTLTELGIIDEADRLWNHSLFSSFENTGNRAAQFEVTISFNTA